MNVDSLVTEMLLGRIDSAEQCEILVTMHGAPGRWWTAKELALALARPTVSTSLDLERLATRDLLDIRIASDVRYRLTPTSQELNKTVALLAEAYRVNRTGVVTEIQRRKGART